MRRFANVFSIVSFAAVGVALALSVLDLITPLTFDVVFAVACCAAMTAFMSRLGLANAVAVATMLLVVAAGLVARLEISGVLLSPYLAIILINGFVAWLFARDLLHGRDPLILRIIRLTGSGPEGSDRFRRFVYRQSVAWALLGTSTALIGCSALVVPAWRPDADFAITALLITQAVLFVLSHIYANRRYDRPETWLVTLRTYSNANVWAKLDP